METVDVIYRQDALEALRTCYETERIDYTNGNEYINYEQAVHEVEQLSSAQPERKKGSWNVIQGNIVVCSECGMLAPKSMTGCLLNRHLEPNRTNFCPNCGADMRGEQE